MSAPDTLALELGRAVSTAQSEQRLPSLSAAVFRDGEVVWSEAVGLAQVESGVEATPEHQYRIGSITKTFTAAAIMQLRDEGRLELDDPLGEHIPGVSHATPTLRRILAHASGLQREFPGEMWEAMVDPPREELLAGVVDAEQVLPPGEHWHYSNLGYALLGEVVARVAGMPAERYLQERILEPLGLSRTTWLPESPSARGYLVEPYQQGVRPEAELVLQRSAPIGQLWSTTGDLARWGAFLADPDPSVLEPATVEQMHAVQVMAEPDRWLLAWGLGPMLHRRGDRIFGGHGGAMPGFLAMLVYSRREKIGAVVLANSSVWPALEETALTLAERAIEAFPLEEEPWRPGTPAPDEIAPLLGRWWTEGMEFVLSYRADRLEARLVDAPRERPPAVFEAEGADRFRVVSGRERGELLRVARDEAGEPVRLYWATYPCTRTPEVFGSAAPDAGQREG
ncbi:MAG: beta-lactamase family protein [Actinobacteria bacterium]|nr:beta-lactamase family protein [Actinomycetota bacterium]